MHRIGSKNGIVNALISDGAEMLGTVQIKVMNAYMNGSNWVMSWRGAFCSRIDDVEAEEE